MGLKDDLDKDVAEIVRSQWTVRDGRTVPDVDSLKMANDAVRFDGVVLYADLSGSTNLVNKKKPEFAAAVYKTFLRCAAKVITSEGGTITAYDGDRVMGVFMGEMMNTHAVKAALKINYARTDIINPAIKKQYPQSDYVVKHVAGVDTSNLFVAKTGIRGSNDLVWVGRAANYAAKLTELNLEPTTWITGEVYDTMADVAKFSNGVNMWVEHSWNAQGGHRIFGSTWRFVIP